MSAVGVIVVDLFIGSMMGFACGSTHPTVRSVNRIVGWVERSETHRIHSGSQLQRLSFLTAMGKIQG
jgi:hypothetical protein